MPNRKKIITITLLFLTCLFYAQTICFVNDTNVRLRDKPSLDSNILRLLKNDEQVQYITSSESEDNSTYKWVYVKTNKEAGWVYGEYLSIKDKNKDYLFLEDFHYVYKNQKIYVGMTEDQLIQTLGKPNQKAFDVQENEISYFYGKNKILTILIHNYNKRVHHIISKDDDLKILDEIFCGGKIPNQKWLKKTSRNRYSINVVNLFKPSVFDVSTQIITDDTNTITEIHIGLPD